MIRLIGGKQCPLCGRKDRHIHVETHETAKAPGVEAQRGPSGHCALPRGSRQGDSKPAVSDQLELF